MTLKVIQGHIRSLLCQNHTNTFVYRPILMKICMNASIMKTQFEMHFYVMEKFCVFFTLRPSNLNTTLTYVLIDNFCPCLIQKICLYNVHTIYIDKVMPLNTIN